MPVKEGKDGQEPRPSGSRGNSKPPLGPNMTRIRIHLEGGWTRVFRINRRTRFFPLFNHLRRTNPTINLGFFYRQDMLDEEESPASMNMSEGAIIYARHMGDRIP